MLRALLITLINIALYFPSVYAQKIRFDRYTTREGLLTDEVYNLHQDRNGYIWIFSPFGTVKYDSREFTPVLSNLSFNQSFVYSMYERTDGLKLIANSKAEFFWVRNDSAIKIMGLDSLSDVLRKKVDEVYQLYLDDSLNIYILTKHRGLKVSSRSNRTVIFDLNSGAADTVSYTIYEKKNAIIPVFNYNGNDSTFCGGQKNINIRFIRPSGIKMLRVECQPSRIKYVKKFDQYSYYSIHNRIEKLSGETRIRFLDFPSYILNFTKDVNDHLWVACLNNGLFELDEKDSIINHYFGNYTVNDVISDSQNGLWVSTNGHGLYHCIDLTHRYYSENEALGKPIKALKLIDSDVIVANVLGDIYRLKNDRQVLIKGGDASGEPLDISAYGNELVVSYRIGIERFQNSGKLIKFGAEKIPNANKLYFTGIDTLVCLQRKRITAITEGRIIWRADFDCKIYSLAMKNGVLLVASEKGIWELQDGQIKRPDNLKELEDVLVKEIVKDVRGNLWFCTYGKGLYLMDIDGRLRHFSFLNGLPSDVVNDLSINGDSCYLLSTNKGLFISNSFTGISGFSDWHRRFSGEVKNAVLLSNHVYMSTGTGLVVFEYERQYITENITFNLKKIVINSVPMDPATLSKLTYTDNNIEIDYDVISFSDDNIRIRYHLFGAINDTGIVDDDYLKFQNLPPGQYLLEAFPDIRGGLSKAISIPFSINPAFWQTRVFKIATLLLGIILFSYAAFLIFRNYKRKGDKRALAEKLVSEYKLIALKAQINPHFMSNCLSAVQHLIMINMLDKAVDYIAKFGMLVRQILSFSSRSLVTIEEELNIARLYVELEQLRFKNEFSFSIQVDAQVDIREVYIPALILNPIIENSIWHGLLPLGDKGSGTLTIDVKMRGESLILVVDDNGVGRPRLFQNIVNSNDSKGIELTRQRLNNINFLFDINSSELVIEDKVDSRGMPEGTRIQITLPSNLKPVNS